MGHGATATTHMYRLTLVVAVALIGVLASACSSGPATTPAAGSTPAVSTPVAGNPTGGAPSGATTFHLVVSDGPKAGTYDLTTTDPGACSVASEGYFIATYMETSKPGLDYIEANLHPGPITGLKYWFDAETDSKVLFVGDGTVTIDVDDRGSTATVTAVSESNLGQQGEEQTTIHTGRAELTVECASVQRAGQ